MRTLSYDDRLTIEEARERLAEVRGEFEGVRGKYLKGWRKYSPWMSGQDQSKLAECVGALLPLGAQASVQEEFAGSVNPDETVHTQSTDIFFKVTDMLASFRNTGTKRIGYSEPFWDK
jgi:hypothetical protein